MDELRKRVREVIHAWEHKHLDEADIRALKAALSAPEQSLADALADPTEEEWAAAATDPKAKPFRGIWLQLLANRRARLIVDGGK